MVKKALKAIYVVPIAFLESLTVSFYENVKKRMDSEQKDKYVELKVPPGHVNEPEYRDLTEEPTRPASMMDLFK